MLTITKQYRAEIAHRLPEHPGRCRFIHGHSYLFEVTVGFADERDLRDMVIDFSELRNAISAVIDPWDHSLILHNTDPLVPEFEKISVMRLNIVPFVPTAENMAIHIAGKLQVAFQESGVVISAVRVWETTTSFAEWRNCKCSE